MKKKAVLFAILLLVVTIIIAVIVNSNIIFKRINDIGGFQVTDITKIDFQYNNPSVKGGNVENKEKVQEFMKYINSCILVQRIPIGMTGYNQSAVFYIGDNIIMRVMFYDDFIEINGAQYNMVKDKLSSEKVDEFVKSIQ